MLYSFEIKRSILKSVWSWRFTSITKIFVFLGVLILFSNGFRRNSWRLCCQVRRFKRWRVSICWFDFSDEICRMKDFELGEGKVIVIKDKDQVFAVGHKCTHYGAPLKGGVCIQSNSNCEINWGLLQWSNSLSLAWSLFQCWNRRYRGFSWNRLNS